MNNTETFSQTKSKVEVRNLSYKVYSNKILNQVCFKVEEGQTVGIIGPNGSGKTSLLKHLYRVLPVEKKTVFINGVDIENYSYRESAQALTVMRQENSTEFEYTVFEIVLMGRSPYKKLFQRDSQEDCDIAYNSLETVGMLDYAKRNFSTLSGGEKQRVLIARSLAQQADILVLDEPTNHLDVHYQWSIMDIIKNLNKTVISVFHELNLACTYCDYLYVMNKGQITAQGRPNEICTPAILECVFRISADIITDNGGKPHIIYKKAIVK